MDDHSQNTFTEENIHFEDKRFRADGTGIEGEPSSKEIKEAVGLAISQVGGVLALKSNLGDIFKRDEDLTRGITAHLAGNNELNISAKVIAEAGYDPDALMNTLAEHISSTLWTNFGLHSDKMKIEIAESMTRQEFYDKYDSGRALH